MAFTNILVWKAFFEEYTFLNFDIQNTETQFKTTALVTALAAIAAVFGWIFTSRVQIINTVRSHSVQVLMNSRNSTVYIDKVDKATVIRRKLILERKPKPDEKVQLTVGEFKDLGDAEKSAVTYLLNFLEFVAIGIRHNNLDEDLIRGSFKSILKSNYILFQKIIEHLRELDNPKIYNQLEMLHKRWDEENHSKCAECKEWYKVGVVEGGFNTAKIVFTYILLNFFTCFLWSIISWIMQVIEWLTIHKESDKFICIDCLKGKDFE